MKHDANDKLMQEKITELDTLSAGIVFGREEAWEKLQQRMEQKPAKALPLRFWISAAAAVLLLFIGIKMSQHTPLQEVTRATGNKEIEKPFAKSVQPIPATVQAVSQKPVKAAVAVDNKVQSASVAGNTNAAIIPQPIADASQPVQADGPVAEKNIVVNEPVTAPAPAMKIVHIDDLERREKTPQTNTTATASVDLRKLPTLHINEVEHQEVEIKRIRRENRTVFGHSLLYKPGYYNYNSNAPLPEEEQGSQVNPLKQILNIQN